MFDDLALPFVQRGLIEVSVLAVGAGLIGTWIVLRGLSFYAHAVGTAAFPGLVLADGLGFSAVLGAFGAAALVATLVAWLARRERDREDALTALVLVAALAIGIVLASDVFHSGANVDTLLFGSLLTIDGRDIAFAAVSSVAVLMATLILGPRWLATGFERSLAEADGNAGRTDAALLLLVALVAVAALAAVGALLATAMLVVPAATTRLLVTRLRTWQVATVALVAAEGLAGMWLAVRTNAPPGATIAVLSGSVFAVVIFGRSILQHRAVRPVALAVVALALVGLAGCGGSGSSSSGSGDAIPVVATTTQLADLVRNLGHTGVNVTQILQPNTDPHDYEPRPDDVKNTAGAKIVFTSGDNLDKWMGDVVSQSGGDPRVVDLGATVPGKVPGETSGPEASTYDPHWWHDPTNVEEAAGQVAAALGRADPAHSETFVSNAAEYVAKLKTLDTGIKACFAKVPAAQRKLVTDHDAFNYFAQRYGIDVIGAVIPSQTTQAQPSAKALVALAKTIKAEGVRAVFPESSVNSKLAKAIATQTGATADHTLYGDTLGPKGSAGATYLTMEQANADSMVRGFTQGKLGCTIPGL